MLKRLLLFLSLPLVLAAAESESSSPSKPIPIPVINQPRPVDFQKEILPILKQNCLACHNRTKHEENLILESPADIQKGGTSGPAVIPKKPDKSLLLALASHSKKPFMPPRKNQVEAHDLTPADLGLIRLWIQQGAAGIVGPSLPVDWKLLPNDLAPILALDLSRDGQFVACSRGSQVFIHRLPTGEALSRLAGPESGPAGIIAHRDLVQSVAFTPDGNTIVSGGYREIRIWRKNDPVFISKSKQKPTSTNQFQTLSPDGKWLAMPARSANAVWILDARKANVSKKLNLPGTAGSLCWLGSEPSLAIGMENGTVEFRGISGTPPSDRKPLVAGMLPITSLACSRTNSQWLLTGTKDGAIRLWDLGHPTQLFTTNHGAGIVALALSDDGKHFTSAGTNGSIKLWTVGGPKVVREIRGTQEGSLQKLSLEADLGLAESEDTFFAAQFKSATTNHEAQIALRKKSVEAVPPAEKNAGDKKVERDTKAGAHAAALKDLDLIPKEKEADRKKASTKVAETKNALDAVEKELAKLEGIASRARDEQKFQEQRVEKAAVEMEKARESSTAAHANAMVARVRLEKELLETRASEKGFTALVFSHTGGKWAALHSSGAIELFSVENGAGLGSLHPRNFNPTALSISPGDDIEATDANGMRVSWTLRPQWILARTIGGATNGSPFLGRVTALAITADGKTMLTGGGDPSRNGEIKLWDLSTGRFIREITNAHSDEVFSLALAPDGSSLASGSADKFARVFDLTTGKRLHSFEGHTHHVLGVAWNPNGRIIASAGADGLVKIWDLAKNLRIGNVEGFPKEVTAIHYLGATGQIAVTGGDGVARVIREKGETVRSFPGAVDFLHASSVTIDGAVFVAGGQDGILRAWKTADGTALFSLKPGRDSADEVPSK